jgi:endonuclease/exonuclease/phosphatase family metal-dependent hydrolase
VQGLWGIILLCLFAVSPLYGEEIKVVSWNLEWFPSGSSRGIASPEAEAKKIASVAEVLKGLNPDILVIQEVRDMKACESLADALKPSQYHVTVCSWFKAGFGGEIGQQQVAILSRSPAVTAWSEDWKSFGVADPPRGFSFAAFRYGTNDVGVYAVHLKSNLTKGDLETGRQLNILKRELAAEQLLAHFDKISSLLSNDLEVVIVAGDFNTTVDQLEFASEKTLPIFRENGFGSGFEDLPLAQRVTIPSKGQFPDATFDYIFVKPPKVAALPIITTNKLSDHYPILRKICLP